MRTLSSSTQVLLALATLLASACRKPSAKASELVLPLMECYLILPSSQSDQFTQNLETLVFDVAVGEKSAPSRLSIYDEASIQAKKWTSDHFQLVPKQLTLRAMRSSHGVRLDADGPSPLVIVELQELWDGMPTERGIQITVEDGHVTRVVSSLAVLVGIPGTERPTIGRERALGIVHASMPNKSVEDEAATNLELTYCRPGLSPSEEVLRGFEPKSRAMGLRLLIPSWYAAVAEGDLEIDGATGVFGILR